MVETAQFDEFYQAEYRAVVRFVMRNGARLSEAEDVAQEAMAQAFRLWATLTNPHAWVRKAANTEIIKAIRRRQREEDLRRALARVDGGPGSEVVIPAGPDEADRVRAVLAGLPEAQREALAFTIDGFTPKETAGIVGKSSEAIRANLREARRRLRTALGDNATTEERPGDDRKEAA